MDDELFHRSGLLYQPGDRVFPGNWGRTILGAGMQHGFFLREYIFETIRSKEFPEKPSRMTSAFACNTRRALQFRERGHDYAVSFANSDAPAHQGDMHWFNVYSHNYTFSGVDECVRRYWRSEPCTESADWEIFAESELTIICRVSSIPDDTLRPRRD